MFFIGLVILGFTVAVPISFILFLQIRWAKKQARIILAHGKIDNPKRTEAFLKLLNTRKDSESMHLWKELNSLYEKYRRVS